jgi:arsenate reductase
MAEGWTRHLHGDRIDPCSAGTRPQSLDPRAVRAMAEAGLDISSHFSKVMDACDPDTIDLVVTVCGHANETCPVFPGRTRVVHRGFDDPPKLTADAQTEEEAMAAYRRVRDEIRVFVETMPELLADSGAPARSAH